uniref:Uncharacterized protein n=1 Tax=Physcomitrium patens TaxID=3218 RepID=A0A2K1JPI7_PHYPA|nr:hypothetical protein PHYPA_015706 [Physcomitrium patens]
MCQTPSSWLSSARGGTEKTSFVESPGNRSSGDRTRFGYQRPWAEASSLKLPHSGTLLSLPTRLPVLLAIHRSNQRRKSVLSSALHRSATSGFTPKNVANTQFTHRMQSPHLQPFLA